VCARDGWIDTVCDGLLLHTPFTLLSLSSHSPSSLFCMSWIILTSSRSLVMLGAPLSCTRLLARPSSSCTIAWYVH
jgi:hypothetical protein